MLQEIQTGNHKNSAILTVTVPALGYGDEQAWQDIRKELEDIGIAGDVLKSNKAFIMQRIQEAAACGAFENNQHNSSLGNSDLPEGDQFNAAFMPKQYRPKNAKSAPAPRVSSLVATMFGYNTSFLNAMDIGDLKKVAKYLNKGADIDSPIDDETTLLWAARQQDIATAKWLLDHGADPDNRIRKVDHNHLNLLTYALCITSNFEMAQILIEYGANLEHRANPWDNTVLYTSATLAQRKTIHWLLDRGAAPWTCGFGHVKVDRRRTYFEIPCLHAVLMNPATTASKCSTIIQMLLDKGADINAQNSMYRKTALSFVSTPRKKKLFDIARWLLDHDADSRIPDLWSRTSLSYAAENNNIQLAELLLLKGASPNTKAFIDPPNLHFSAFRVLLDHGYDDLGVLS